MTEEQRISDLNNAVHKWQRARQFIKDDQRVMEADRRDVARRLMELDEAIDRLTAVASTQEAREALTRAHKAMMEQAA